MADELRKPRLCQVGGIWFCDGVAGTTAAEAYARWFNAPWRYVPCAYVPRAYGRPA